MTEPVSQPIFFVVYEDRPLSRRWPGTSSGVSAPTTG
jgi:hypothetical protein